MRDSGCARHSTMDHSFGWRQMLHDILRHLNMRRQGGHGLRYLFNCPALQPLDPRMGSRLILLEDEKSFGNGEDLRRRTFGRHRSVKIRAAKHAMGNVPIPHAGEPVSNDSPHSSAQMPQRGSLRWDKFLVCTTDLLRYERANVLPNLVQK